MRVTAAIGPMLATLAALTGGASAFGPRGMAERTLYYLVYLGEEALPEGERQFATGCAGSRAGRCYLSEFLNYIDGNPPEPRFRPNTYILGTCPQIALAEHNWRAQQAIVDGTGDFQEPRSTVQGIWDGIADFQFKTLQEYNPPNPNMRAEMERWKAANPNWSGGPTGDGFTNPTYRMNRERTYILPMAVQGAPAKGGYYSKFLNLHNIFAEFPTGSEVNEDQARFQELFERLSERQNTIHDRVHGFADNDPRKGRGLSILEKVSWAGDLVLEERIKDYWNTVINGVRDKPNPTLVEKGLKDPINFGEHLELDPIQGRWGLYELPNKEQTIKNAVRAGKFTKEQALALWDSFDTSPSSVAHMNVLTTIRGTLSEFHGGINPAPICAY